MNRIIDNLGNVYEYNPDNGLISKNDIIVSGADHEPVFSNYPDNSQPPIFVGIYLKKEGKVLGMSGTPRSLTDHRQL